MNKVSFRKGKFGVKSPQRINYVKGNHVELYIIQLPCQICGLLKPSSEFCKKANTLTGLQSHCKDCMNKRAKERWHKEEFREENLKRKNISSKKTNNKTRVEVLNLLSGQCVCCGEKDFDVLQIDHVNGGGNQHRRESNFASVDRYIKVHGIDREYAILCDNCHRAKTNYNYCPHKENNLDNFILTRNEKQIKRFTYKVKLYDIYENMCCVCMSKQFEFFELNHIYSPKSEHYNGMPRGGWTLFQYLLSHGFDKNLFNLMCANCHSKMHREELRNEK